ICPGQYDPGYYQARYADYVSCRFETRPRGREDHDASHPLGFHRVEDVTISLWEDLRRASSCRGSECDEDRLLTRDCAVDRRGIEDVSSNDRHRFTGNRKASGVADEGRHRVTVGDGSFRQQTPRLPRGPKDCDLHDLAQTRSWQDL